MSVDEKVYPVSIRVSCGGEGISYVKESLLIVERAKAESLANALDRTLEMLMITGADPENERISFARAILAEYRKGEE